MRTDSPLFCILTSSVQFVLATFRGAHSRRWVCLHHSRYLLDTAIRIKTKAGTFTNLPTVQPKALSLQGSAARWFRASGMWRYIGKESRRVPALLAMEGKMAGLILNRQPTDSVTRRGVLIGTAASLLCTPAIVRASSLMPVRGLIMPIERPNAGFAERLCYSFLDYDLKIGRTESSLLFNGRRLSEGEMRRIVAYGWRHGFVK
jgi:hypothetical protein